jgi:hypothetical protein
MTHRTRVVPQCDCGHSANTTLLSRATYVGKAIDLTGGRTRTRTLDPLIKSQLLYQLSYAP